MPLRVTNFRLPVEVPEEEVPAQLAKRLKCAESELTDYRILRKSLDARNRKNLCFVYTIHFSRERSVREFATSGNLRVEEYQESRFQDPDPGPQPLKHRPVIVGTGPAGLLAAYYLAVRGYAPLVIERGQPVKERVPAIRKFDRGGDFDEENNYLFGEGGAGCFSDGKLTCRMSGPDVDWVLDSFVTCGGRESIRYEHRPHLGSNKLPMICRNFRRKIEALGGEYLFGCRLEGFEIAEGVLAAIRTSRGRIPAEVCVLGIGHSARDTYEMLEELGLPMVPKAFQLGLRIEQPQEQVNHHKYGRQHYLELLGAADYTMVAHAETDVYTFCMCAGGYVIPSVSEPGYFCTNGMSNSRHDSPFANSGIMVTLQPDRFEGNGPLAGIRLQQRFEKVAFSAGRDDYLVPIQSATGFLHGKGDGGGGLPSSYQRGSQLADLNNVLPPSVCDSLRRGLLEMDEKWGGKFLKQATLVGPEMRGSAPLRMERDRLLRTSPGFEGIYPVGEGAGYAGGIISAAVDGLRSAKQLVSHYAAVK